MDDATLSAIAVSVLAASIASTVGEAAKAGFRRAHALVQGKLLAKGQGDVYDRFERQPGGERERRDLDAVLGIAIRDDREFAVALRAAVEQARAVTASSVGGNQVQNVGGIAVGGNASGATFNQGNTHHNTTHNRRGGVLAALIALAALVLVVVIVGIAKGVGGPTLNADSTCEEFLVLDAVSRDQTLKRVAVELGSDVFAGPFGNQNAEYACGGHPDWTLRYMMTGN